MLTVVVGVLEVVVVMVGVLGALLLNVVVAVVLGVEGGGGRVEYPAEPQSRPGLGGEKQRERGGSRKRT